MSDTKEYPKACICQIHERLLFDEKIEPNYQITGWCDCHHDDLYEIPACETHKHLLGDFLDREI